MQRVTKRSSIRRGFTIIELLLVLVILAVLAAVIVPKFTGRGEDARIAAAKTDIANIKTCLGMFENDNGRYPTSEEGLAALVQAPGNLASSWKGPYMEGGVPQDPWKHPYQYRCPGSHNPNGYDLFSQGKDGKTEGGNGLDNWEQ